MNKRYPCFRTCWILMLLLAGSVHLSAQQVMVTADFDGLTFEAFVTKAEAELPVRFFFGPFDAAAIGSANINEPAPLVSFLNGWLQPVDLSASIDRSGNVFLLPGSPVSVRLSRDIYPDILPAVVPEKSSPDNREGLETSSEFIPKVITVGTRKDGLGKNRIQLRGVILDLETDEPIPQASLLFVNLEKGILADDDGKFQTTLPKGTHTLVVRDMGHEEVRVTVELLSEGEITLRLIPRAIQLDDVVISSERDNPVQNTMMGFERINTRAARDVPVVLGEQDILKVATLLPGVQNVGEGSAGFNVRGSPADQNMFYLEQVPVYNTSHMFGFFSSFHSDALSGFSLYKSNIPSEYGGRLAATFDLEAREADKDRFQMEGGISPITGRLVVGTPLVKGKSSAMFSARSTYSNWILRRIPNNDFRNSDIYFGDATAYFTFQPNDQNKIKIFGYGSLDDIQFGLNTQFRNRNLGGSASWLHFFNDRNDLEISAVHSRLNLDVANTMVSSEAYQLSNALAHSELRAALTLRPNQAHRIRMGGNTVLYQNYRGNYGPFGSSSLISPIELGLEQGLESGLFVEDDFRVNERLSVQAGLRYNVYTFLGPGDVLQYPDGEAMREETVVDTITYGSFEPVKTYQGLDWRVSGKLALGTNVSLKASLNRLHQYSFLLSNTIALAPTDKWKLVDANIRPMVGDQASLGIYSNLFRGMYQVSVEGYLKRVQNLVEYRDGADLLINEVPEWDVLQGDLQAYGVEFMLRKTSGRLTGWANYTFSRSIVTVDGNGQTDQQVNFGLSYPANFDRPHSANVALTWRLNRRINISGNVVYASGKPITYPTSIFYLNNVRLVSFTTRNEYRLPDYFRVDLAVNVEGNLRAKKLAHGSWTFAIYNLTGRDNVYNAYFSSVSGQLRGYRISIFAIPVFSATYNFKLGNYES